MSSSIALRCVARASFAAVVTATAGAAPEHAVVAEIDANDRTVSIVAVEPIISMPAQVDLARLIETKVYDDPRFGVMYRYVDVAGANIDVFVYPLGDAQLITDDEKALDWIEADFRDGLKAAKAQGQYKKVKITGSETLVEAGTLGPFTIQLIAGHMPAGGMRRVTARFDYVDARWRSEMICFAIEGMAVKIRRSEPEASAPAAGAIAFARELHGLDFVRLPPDPGPQVVYANRWMGLHGVIGASVRAARPLPPVAPAPAMAPVPATTPAPPASPPPG